MLDRPNIQGLVLFGYRRQPHGLALMLHFDGGVAARRWIAHVAAHVRTACETHAKNATSLNAAFSVTGLRAIGLAEGSLETFPPEFYATMKERRRVLGDVAENEPERWRFGGPKTPSVDGIALLYAETEDSLRELEAREKEELAAAGISVVHEVRTAALPGSIEPFGFRDGIVQPQIEGMSNAAIRDDGMPSDGPPLKAGELLMGYDNEYGSPAHAPTVSASDDPGEVLSGAVGDPSRRSLGRDGSYLVCRQIEQRVDAFWRTVREQAEIVKVDPELLAAKMVGRFKNGAPLVGPDSAREGDYEVKRFSYAEDPDGLQCPFGAHIRRTNPRASKAENPETEKERGVALDAVRGHRLVRRGRPYATQTGAQSEQGLLFLAFNANLRRQFEFVQQTWVTNPKFERLHEEDDPLIGARPPGTGVFTIPGEPIRKRLLDLPAFTVVRGGEYFFMPSVRALSYLGRPMT